MTISYTVLLQDPPHSTLQLPDHKSARHNRLAVIPSKALSVCNGVYSTTASNALLKILPSRFICTHIRYLPGLGKA